MNSKEVINSQQLAITGLMVSASKVNESLGAFSGWLIAGVGAAFSLLIANYETVVGFVAPRYIRLALLLLVIGLVVSIFARLLSAMVSASIGSHEATTQKLKELSSAGEAFDLSVFMFEFERGLFPYQRWLMRRTTDKALKGDLVASARLVAKLSQVQALLVLAETLIAIMAAALLVAGLK